MKKSMVFLTYLNGDYSRSGVYFRGVQDLGCQAELVQMPPKFFAQLRVVRDKQFKRSKKDSQLIVMSPSHRLVIALRLNGYPNLVLDAGWPLSDSLERISINDHPKIILKKARVYLIDFLCFKSAQLILVESLAQSEYISRKFLVQKRKLRVLETGVNEKLYKGQYQVEECPIPEICPCSNSEAEGYVLFRGKSNVEAGLDIIEQVAQELESNSINFVIASPDLAPTAVNSVRVLRNFLSYEQISHLYRYAILCVGQFGEHRRLARTIPHKAFESSYFGKPFISLPTEAISEFDRGIGATIFIPTRNPHQIASAIKAQIDSGLISELGARAKMSYEEHYKQSKLSSSFLRLINEFFNS
jgi:hypothetical protein